MRRRSDKSTTMYDHVRPCTRGMYGAVELLPNVLHVVQIGEYVYQTDSTPCIFKGLTNSSMYLLNDDSYVIDTQNAFAFTVPIGDICGAFVELYGNQDVPFPDDELLCIGLESHVHRISSSIVY